MSEINRYWFGLYESCVMRSAGGNWVRYEDHVAAMKAAHPEAKFKVGDVVVTALKTTPWTIVSMQYNKVNEEWYYRSSSYRLERECNVYLYTPPTPAELIPTLVEHEWVRWTDRFNKTYGPVSLYKYGGELWGRGCPIKMSDGSASGNITSIERCDPPEVK